ncbi:hypothetical protein BSY238_3369 [Methyloversatilis sp. RAC08]|nr:hypothetical protein BSY238_3369 [Methyloversatilis sp. RAC08]
MLDLPCGRGHVGEARWQLRRFCGSGGLAAIGALINDHRGINRGEAAAPTARHEPGHHLRHRRQRFHAAQPGFAPCSHSRCARADGAGVVTALSGPCGSEGAAACVGPALWERPCWRGHMAAATVLWERRQRFHAPQPRFAPCSHSRCARADGAGVVTALSGPCGSEGAAALLWERRPVLDLPCGRGHMAAATVLWERRPRRDRRVDQRSSRHQSRRGRRSHRRRLYVLPRQAVVRTCRGGGTNAASGFCTDRGRYRPAPHHRAPMRNPSTRPSPALIDHILQAIAW